MFIWCWSSISKAIVNAIPTANSLWYGKYYVSPAWYNKLRQKRCPFYEFTDMALSSPGHKTCTLSIKKVEERSSDFILV